MTFDNNNFTNNTAILDGSSFYFSDLNYIKMPNRWGFIEKVFANITIKNCNIIKSISSFSSGSLSVYSTDSNILINNCTFI